MQTLWLSFPEETLAQVLFDTTAQKRLETIFDSWDRTSPWRQALERLGYRDVPEVDMIAWHKDKPYFNGTAMAWLVSCGTALPVPDAAQGYIFTTQYKLRNFFKVFQAQWKVTRFLQRCLAQPVSVSDPSSALSESIALGLAMQVLLMRLDKSARAKMPQYLAQPASAPALHRKTFQMLQAVQVRRTALSSVWQHIFPMTREDRGREKHPAYFWDTPDGAGVVVPLRRRAQNDGITDVFTGLPVSGGVVTGRAVVLLDAADIPAREKDIPRIFVFRYARPDTTACFAAADAVLYATGGVLSHACVVAREQGVTCVTGLGDDFFERVSSGSETWLSVDAAQGRVEIISR